MIKKIFYCVVVTASVLLINFNCSAQIPGQDLLKPKVVQVSGVVVTGKEQNGVPGVYFYVPKAGRGAISNQVGFFSLATSPGDSAIITAIGFKRQYYIVPNDGRQSISVIITLREDTIYTPEVEVLPFPTEELFKEAFLTLKLPEEGQTINARKNLSPKAIAKLANQLPNDGSMNFRQYVIQQSAINANRTFSPTIQLTNPFAWARFIQSVRRGDLKKRDWKKEQEEQEAEERKQNRENAVKRENPDN
jgi:hypothetical protein